MTHEAHIEEPADGAFMATCSCGWDGRVRKEEDDAHEDMLLHLTEG